MASKSGKAVTVLDLTSRKKVEDIALSPFIGEQLDDHGEIYLAVRALEAQMKPKPGYTKSRGEIAGSTKKMYRQKGTGRARHSTNKAPQFVGGGRAHGPKGLQAKVKLNKKVWRKAMQLLLADRISDNKVLVFNSLDLEERSTKKALGLFPELSERVTFIGKDDMNLAYSVRNLPAAVYCDADFANVLDLAYSDVLVFSKDAFLKVLARIQKTVSRGARHE